MYTNFVRKFSHDLITYLVAHVIRAKKFTWYSFHFRVKFARIFVSHVMWNFSTFFNVKFIIFMIYEVLITWIWCEKISHQIHIKIFSCVFFMWKWQKNFTRNSYVIRVKIIRKFLSMKFMHGNFVCVSAISEHVLIKDLS